MAKKEMDQLTKDSISAQKAGMSYGKWIAIHRPIDGKTTKSANEENVVRCVVCGEVMVDVRKGRKYCSPECSSYIASIKCRERYRKRVAECG